MSKLSLAAALVVLVGASLLAAPARAKIVLCSPVRVACQQSADLPSSGTPDLDAPLDIPPGRQVNLILNIWARGAGDTLGGPVWPSGSLNDPFLAHGAQFATLDRVQRHNIAMLLLAGKRPNCVNCVFRFGWGGSPW